MRAQAWAGLAVVLAIGGWMRLPPLVNAGALNSDAAIIGVQALDILSGRWATQLYGTDYQAAVEPVLAAGLMGLGVPSFTAVALVPFLGMLAMLAIVYGVLVRKLAPLAATLCTLPLALGSMAVNMPMMYGVRQCMALAVVSGVALLHFAPQSRFKEAMFFGGALLSGLSVAIDTFALVIAPAVALFGVLCLAELRANRKALLLCGLWALAGAVLAGFGAAGLGHLDGSAGGLMARHLKVNAPLLWERTLPFALNAKIWVWADEGPAWLWKPAGWFRVFQALGGVVAFSFLVAAPLFARASSVSWQSRRLSVLGGSAALLCLGVFLFSRAPVDEWSTRYLAPLVWLAPFALAAWGERLRTPVLAALLLPWLVSSVAGAWVGWGPYVDGARIVKTARARGEREDTLRNWLREQRVESAAAEYWSAYRLSLWFSARPKVVPLAAHQDRIPHHRRVYDNGSRVALLFDRTLRTESSESYRTSLTRAGVNVTPHDVAGFEVLLGER
ncbi:MAG: hypothetical protein ACKVPX_18595 [Myxococcaceae bacterium]